MSSGYITRKAGGQGISFSLSNYPTAASLPSTAVDGAYAIISNADISRFYISGSEPLNPIANSVWVKNSIFQSEESINVISGDRLIITPIEFLQRSGNAWVHKEAYVFKNSEWKPYKEFLVKDGKYTSLLGGFTSDNESDKANFKYNSKRSYLEFVTESYRSLVDFTTTSNYGLKQYSRIGIEYSSTENVNAVLSLRDRINTSACISVKTVLENISEKITKKAYLNIEDVLNAGYNISEWNFIGINIEPESLGAWLRIYDMWLE